jgi:SAM-dependent methyltransferase
MNPNQAKKATQQLLDRYGGDIQKGTQSRIDAALSSLPSHIQQAASLYKQLTQFDALIAPMTEPDRKRLIPPEQWAVSASNRNTLQQLMKEHSITENDLHNIYQKITWDASADAKATRADIAGNAMKDNLQERISRACEITVEAVASNSDNHDRTGMLLDIGCGHGSIIPSLDNLAHDSYVGIDLSDEMIRNARERYGDADARGKKRVFVADDFLTHDFSVYARQDGMNDSQNNGSDIFDAVMFCSSLHDLPDMEHCIGRAASLLRSGGKLVVVHAQGAMVR